MKNAFCGYADNLQAGKFMEKGDENEVFKDLETAVISAYSLFITFLIVNYTVQPPRCLHINKSRSLSFFFFF